MLSVLFTRTPFVKQSIVQQYYRIAMRNGFLMLIG